MANLKSAKKAIRKTKRRTKRNLTRKAKLQNVIKGVKKLIEEGKFDEARKKIPELQKIIDKAAKINLIHKKKASRVKKKIARKLRPKKK